MHSSWVWRAGSGGSGACTSTLSGKWIFRHGLDEHPETASPCLSVEASLRLELDVPADDELSTVWLLAATLLPIWEQRQVSNKVQPYLVRAQLEAKVNLLRQTSFSNCAKLIIEKVQLMFEYC